MVKVNGRCYVDDVAELNKMGQVAVMLTAYSYIMKLLSAQQIPNSNWMVLQRLKLKLMHVRLQLIVKLTKQQLF